MNKAEINIHQSAYNLTISIQIYLPTILIAITLRVKLHVAIRV